MFSQRNERLNIQFEVNLLWRLEHLSFALWSRSICDSDPVDSVLEWTHYTLANVSDLFQWTDRTLFFIRSIHSYLKMYRNCHSFPSIVQNQTSSYLIIQQLQSNFDYGLYTCNASNRLGKNSTTIQLRSKGKGLVTLNKMNHQSTFMIDIHSCCLATNEKAFNLIFSFRYSWNTN